VYDTRFVDRGFFCGKFSPWTSEINIDLQKKRSVEEKESEVMSRSRVK